MGIYRGGVEYTNVYRAGQELATVYRGGVEYFSSGPPLGGATRIGSAAAFGLAAPNPGGMTDHLGTLYMVAWISGGPGACLFTMNPETGVATRVGNAVNFGLNPAEDVPGGLGSHLGVLYMVGDRTHNLYTVNTVTGVATRVGAATNFGIAETSPAGLASRFGVLYMLGRSQGLSTLNTATGVATQVAAVSGGPGQLHGMEEHGGVFYAIADTQRALYTINPATAAAARFGSAPAGFGVGENDPRGLGRHRGKLFMIGNTLDALLELNVPPGQIHTFGIVSASRSNTVGYNSVAGWGSIVAGERAVYRTPGGKNVTVIHLRSVREELNVSLSGAAAVRGDFPSRIVATKTTGGVVERTFLPQAGNPSSVTGGFRLDYDPESGAVGDVFVNRQTVYVDLYY